MQKSSMGSVFGRPARCSERIAPCIIINQRHEMMRLCEKSSAGWRHNRWGFWMMFSWLRKNDYQDNHKRVYRIYSAMKLNMRRKHKKRLPSRVLSPLVQPEEPNQNWSMDFMHDGLIDGRPFRCFNVIDEFIAYAMEHWYARNEIKLVFIQKGKPHQNGYIERFNRTYREEVLDNYCFENLQQARRMTQAWIWVYNNERPHSSLGYLTPREFLVKCGKRSRAQEPEKAFPTFQQDSNNMGKYIFNCY